MAHIVNMSCSIYLLTNKIDGKIYIGQTWGEISKRMGKEGRNYHNSTYIYNAIQKYGSINFEYSILLECEAQEEADRMEVEYIEKYNSRDHKIGYNISLGGLGGRRSPDITAKIVASRMENQETQNKVIEAYKSGMTINEIKKTFGFSGNGKIYRILDKNNVERLNNFSKWTGRTHSKETKEKMTASAEEHWSSNEERERASEVGKNRNQNKLSTEQAKEVSIKYYEGKSIKDLSDEYNCSRQAICTALKLMNTKMRSRGGRSILSIR